MISAPGSRSPKPPARNCDQILALHVNLMELLRPSLELYENRHRVPASMWYPPMLHASQVGVGR